MQFYAHSRNPAGVRQVLIDHLQAVSILTSRFAAPFGAAELGRYVGLWHDVGKFNAAFRQYLLDCEANPQGKHRGPDHKAAGTSIASKYMPPLALLVQGHHGGLQSWNDLGTWLQDRMKDPAVSEAMRLARAAVPDLEPLQPLKPPPGANDPLQAELFLRMLFSALVDADCLDTEAHFSPDQAAVRGSSAEFLPLWQRFEAHHQALQSRVAVPVPDHDPQDGDQASRSRHVARIRAELYDACVAAADGPKGLYRLAIPTGGGKTLSGMAFALRHAIKHNITRVIVAVPFITITQQTVQVYREIFEPEGWDQEQPVVLEHHSGIDISRKDREPEDFHAEQVWQRLAAENWDAPIVVTTTVQLFESLFACKTRATRKLHRLANSVIILDEAQALPPHLLTPILDVLRQLCERFGATVVLSTATQPAFDILPDFAKLAAHDVVPDAVRYYGALRRVGYEWRIDPALAWAEVAALMRSEQAVLCIVNTKRDALALLDELGDQEEVFHLSTLLCGAHRRAVLDTVKARLAAGQPCLLVSTQVIEAGVDLDFPVVLRALAPLDAIIQAAGRCNREGRLEVGRVIVFEPVNAGMPVGAYKIATNTTRTMLGAGPIDPDDPEVARTYYTRLLRLLDLDAKRIQSERERLNYPAVASLFRMIEEDTENIVVGYGTSLQRRGVIRILEQLRDSRGNPRLLLRLLQPYMVAVRSRQVQDFKRKGWILPVIEGLGEWKGGYDPIRGLTGQDSRPDVWVV